MVDAYVRGEWQSDHGMRMYDYRVRFARVCGASVRMTAGCASRSEAMPRLFERLGRLLFAMRRVYAPTMHWLL